MKLVIACFLASFNITNAYADWSAEKRGESIYLKNDNESPKIKKITINTEPNIDGKYAISFVSCSQHKQSVIDSLSIFISLNLCPHTIFFSVRIDDLHQSLEQLLNAVHDVGLFEPNDTLESIKSQVTNLIRKNTRVQTSRSEHLQSTVESPVGRSPRNFSQILQFYPLGDINREPLPNLDVPRRLTPISSQPLPFDSLDQVLQTSFDMLQPSHQKTLKRPENCSVIIDKTNCPPCVKEDIETLTVLIANECNNRDGKDAIEKAQRNMQRCPICQGTIAAQLIFGTQIIQVNCDGKHIFCEECLDNSPDTNICCICRGEIKPLET